MNWLVFALMTVVSWGLYGVFLHTGQMGMADPVNGRYKAFLFVGCAFYDPTRILRSADRAWSGPSGRSWHVVSVVPLAPAASPNIFGVI